MSCTIPSPRESMTYWSGACEMKRLTSRCVLLICLVSVAMSATHAAAASLQDIVLILDNSGSMKKNDPLFLAKDAVTQFVENASEDSRIGIVIFDQAVRLPIPLTPALAENRARILASLDNIDYRGLFTNSSAAVERAIYELRINGRPDAEKIAIFMTDGIVDTGDANADLASAKWMREDLAAEAAEQQVKIFGIAFTENADFQLIQSLARRTGADYFRATTAADLANVFNRIQDVLAQAAEEARTLAQEKAQALAQTQAKEQAELADKLAQEAKAVAEEQAQALASIIPEPVPEPVAIETVEPPLKSNTAAGSVALEAPELNLGAAQREASVDSMVAGQPLSEDGKSEPSIQTPSSSVQPTTPSLPLPPPDDPGTLWLLVVGGGSVVVLFGLFLIVRAFRSRPAETGAAGARTSHAEAFLRDMSGVSGSDRNDLKASFVMVGRIPSGLSGDYQDIVIDSNTIGRQHAVIEYRDYAYWLRDQNSLNGTFVNGTRIQAEVRLNHGDRIAFHEHEFRFGMPSMQDSDKTVMAGAGTGDGDQTVLSAGESLGPPIGDMPAERMIPRNDEIAPRPAAPSPGSDGYADEAARKLVERFQDDPLIDFDLDSPTDSPGDDQSAPGAMLPTSGSNGESLIAQFDTLTDESGPDDKDESDITALPGSFGRGDAHGDALPDDFQADGLDETVIPVEPSPTRLENANRLAEPATQLWDADDSATRPDSQDESSVSETVFWEEPQDKSTDAPHTKQQAKHQPKQPPKGIDDDTGGDDATLLFGPNKD